MKPAVIIGLVGGASVGAGLGVALERHTHVPEDQPLSTDAVKWERGFRDHFADEIDADAQTDATRRSSIEAWHRASDPPEWLDVSRSDVGWNVTMPEPESRGTNGWLMAVGLLGGLVAVLPIVAFDRSGTDVRSFHGWHGAAAFAPIAAVGGFIGAYLVSDASH